MSEKFEKFILLPPGLNALAAMASIDDEEDAGVPYHKHQMGGVQISQDGDTVVCTASNGRIAGIYRANIDKRMDGETRGPVVEELQHFPDIEAIIPTDAPVMTIRFDPELLIQVLKACQKCAGFSGHVTMELRGAGKIMVFRAVNERRGREFTALMMPMEK